MAIVGAGGKKAVLAGTAAKSRSSSAISSLNTARCKQLKDPSLNNIQELAITTAGGDSRAAPAQLFSH